VSWTPRRERGFLQHSHKIQDTITWQLQSNYRGEGKPVPLSAHVIAAARQCSVQQADTGTQEHLNQLWERGMGIKTGDALIKKKFNCVVGVKVM
jgi:hypothetical protein